MSSNQVYICKNNINKALAEKSSEYWTVIKKWLKHIYSEQELNEKTRKLFGKPEDCLLHTNFMIALKNRISVPNIPVRKSRKSNRKKPAFEPAQIQDYAPVKHTPVVKQDMYTNGGLHVETFAAQELFLPDKAMVLGRLLVAMNEEIEDVSESAAEIIVQASHIFLKNVLTTILTKYSSYKTYEMQPDFKYDVGVELPNPWFLDDSKISKAKKSCNLLMIKNVDKAEQMDAFADASTSPKKKKKKEKSLTIEQVYETIKLYRNMIANHSVYSLSRERISLELDG